MGWSWSLFLCNSSLTSGLVSALLEFNPNLSRSAAVDQVVRERAPAPRLRRRQPLLGPYVDNGNILSHDEDESCRFHDVVVRVFESLGFVLKDLVAGSKWFDMVGIIWDGQRRHWIAKPERVWRLRTALLELADRKTASGTVLRIVGGHMVNMSLLCRPALSIMDEIFTFAEAAGDSWRVIPPSLRAELRVFAALLPLMYHDPYRRLAPVLYCSDSSLKGYALHRAALDAADGDDLIRYRERWRFRDVELEPLDDCDQVGAGTSADLQSLGPRFDAWVRRQSERKVAGVVRVPAPARMPRRLVEVPESVPPVPDRLVNPRGWSRVVVGAWKSEAAIHLKEGRVSLLGLKIQARSPGIVGSIVPALGDNMGEVVANDRGRGRDKAVNALCRRSAAIRLGACVDWPRRYVDTARNPSDADSRIADRGGLRPGERLRAGWRAGAAPAIPRWHGFCASPAVLVVGSGAADLVAAAADVGLKVAPPLDRSLGVLFDLRNRDVHSRVLGWILSRRIWWLHASLMPGGIGGAPAGWGDLPVIIVIVIIVIL